MLLHVLSHCTRCQQRVLWQYIQLASAFTCKVAELASSSRGCCPWDVPPQTACRGTVAPDQTWTCRTPNTHSYCACRHAQMCVFSSPGHASVCRMHSCTHVTLFAVQNAASVVWCCCTAHFVARHESKMPSMIPSSTSATAYPVTSANCACDGEHAIVHQNHFRLAAQLAQPPFCSSP